MPTIPTKYQSRKLVELNRQIHAHGGWSDQISKNKDLTDILTIIYKINTVDVDRILVPLQIPTGHTQEMSTYGGHKDQLGLDEEQQTGPVQCPSPGGLQSDNRVLSKAKTWRLQALLN